MSALPQKIGLQWGKRFTTNVVREEKIVKVTRVQ